MPKYGRARIAGRMTNSSSGWHFAIKDLERAHPVASAWRPTFAAVIEALANADYERMSAMDGVEPLSDGTSRQIRDYVADYGEALIPLPEQAWDSSEAQWMGDRWDVLVDLWTKESGPSDMVLDAKVKEIGDGIRVEIHAVYVP